MNILSKSILFITLPTSLICSWCHTHFTSGYRALTYYELDFTKEAPNKSIAPIAIKPYRAEHLVEISSLYRSETQDQALDDLNETLRRLEFGKANQALPIVEPPFVRDERFSWAKTLLKAIPLTAILSLFFLLQHLFILPSKHTQEASPRS